MADAGEFKPGAYQVQVHVIEARDIKAKNPSPKMIVEVLETKKATPKVKNSFNPYFDYTLFFEESDVSLDKFEYGKISIAMFNTNTALRAEMIGSYELDLMTVYDRDHHELYKTWIPLTDPTDAKEGVQAVVKVSVTVLGPGDEPYVHDEKEEDEEEDESGMLMPPRMQTEDHLLVMQFHRAEGLPKVDTALIGKATIDPYYVVNFAGISLRTRAHSNNQSPVFCEEMRIPVTMPCMTDRIVLHLYDKDKIDKDDLIGTTKLRFSKVPCVDAKDVAEPAPGGGYTAPPGAITTWVHMYGPMGRDTDTIAMKMRKGQMEGSKWLGRVLVTYWHFKVDVAKKEVVPINSVEDPPEQEYIARANVMQAANLPFDSNVRIELNWLNHHTDTKVKSGKNGTVQWYEELKDINVKLPPAHPKPDLFVYLLKGEKTRVAYKRFPVDELIGKTSLTVPQWVVFTEDPAVDKIPAGTSAGEVLLSVEVGLAKDIATRAPLIRPSFMPCVLYSYIYMGKSLPAVDVQEGSLDPYVVISFSGSRIKFPEKRNTRYPVWNKMQKTEVDVIYPSELAPKLTVALWDADDASGDDKAGTFQVDISDIKNTFSKPVWRTFEQTPGRAGCGELLCSFQLVPMTEKFTPPSSIVPPSQDRLVEFTILGLRNLAPYNMVKIQKPSIEVELYGVKYKTKKSKKPSGSNPNYIECASFTAPIPMEPTYSQPLIVNVYDHRLMTNPKVASCCIPLAPFFPQDGPAPRSKVVTGEDEIQQAEDSEEDHMGSAVMGGGGDSAEDETEKGLLAPAVDEEGSEVEEDMSESEGEEYADLSAKYMEGREKLKCELEDTLTNKPFYEQTLVRPGRKGDRPVGVIKGNIFIPPAGLQPNEIKRPINHAELSMPKHYVVRLYVLRGVNLTPKDSDGLSDPILEISLGRKKFIDNASLRYDTINPEFYCFYELDAILPGQSRLQVSVLDSDLNNLRHELIGRTSIDLENYFFSEEWTKMEKKPVESRTLISDLTPLPQGALEMWVDIIDPRLKSLLPPVDISPPPPVPFEMRVVVWKAEKVLPGDYIGDMSDMYFSVELQAAGTHSPPQRHDTDVHWRATKGEGSFNYRLIFDLELPMKQPRLTFTAWDQDIVGSNDPLGTCTINPKVLQRTMVAAYRSMNSAFLRVKKGADVNQESSVWLRLPYPLKPEQGGRVYVQVEILPKSMALRKPAGKGRSAPNANPYLPPTTRVEWNFLRPDLLLKKLIGPDLFNKLKGAICCVIYCIFMGFFLYFFGQFASILGLVF